MTLSVSENGQGGQKPPNSLKTFKKSRRYPNGTYVGIRAVRFSPGRAHDRIGLGPSELWAGTAPHHEKTHVDRMGEVRLWPMRAPLSAPDQMPRL
ncbi:hypothetical protein DL237_07425 [Pseudooceanicola sediminis]|uniref:Uncharacterized protein n=1 Tax=Pseudooceanicola sediminis TaxID=2211117 RepID=A0A399J203_9RHOB|nr:hypothetical protein DL237_07425 [Pseudooceanicola sediminis]